MIRHAAVVTALAGAALLAGTTTAAANPMRPDYIHYFSGKNCHPNRHALRLFRDAGYSGGGVLLQRGDSISSLPSFNFNDAMSSWANDSGVTCRWYTDGAYRGVRHEMFNGYRIELPATRTTQPVRCNVTAELLVPG